MQARLLDEQAFRNTVAVLQAGQASLRTHMRGRSAARLKQSMDRCVALSRARAARARRVQRLKVQLEETRGTSGVDPELIGRQALLLSPRGMASPLPQAQASPPGAAGGRSAAAEHARHSSLRAPSLSCPFWRSAGVLLVNNDRADADGGNEAGSALAAALDDPDDPMLGSRVTKRLAYALATLSYYAVHVHLAFGLVFICDFSIAAAVFPLGSLLYALVASPHARFWKVLLIYTEGLLLLQYVFQVAVRAGCLALETDAHSRAARIGLHDSAVRPALLSRPPLLTGLTFGCSLPSSHAPYTIYCLDKAVCTKEALGCPRCR